MTCPECNGTGKTTLFSSVEECVCVKNSPFELRFNEVLKAHYYDHENKLIVLGERFRIRFSDIAPEGNKLVVQMEISGDYVGYDYSDAKFMEAAYQRGVKYHSDEFFEVSFGTRNGSYFLQ